MDQKVKLYSLLIGTIGTKYNDLIRGVSTLLEVVIREIPLCEGGRYILVADKMLGPFSLSCYKPIIEYTLRIML